MTTLQEWAAAWGIQPAALDDLRVRLGAHRDHTSAEGLVSEAGVSKHERLKAAAAGEPLWRNNVGACVDERGNHIRYGLANESRQMNKHIKSSDLIGIRPVYITQAMVGSIIGQFVARECKRPGWRFVGNDHEMAQLKFIEIVISHGGDAAFTTGE